MWSIFFYLIKMNNLKFKITDKDSKISGVVFKHLDGSPYILN